MQGDGPDLEWDTKDLAGRSRPTWRCNHGPLSSHFSLVREDDWNPGSLILRQNSHRYRGPHPQIVSISSDALRVAVSGPRR